MKHLVFLLVLFSFKLAAAAPACRSLFSDNSVLSLFAKSGAVAPRYESFLTQLSKAKPGTKFSFLPGEEFTLKQYLGEGETTVIVETMEGKTLRIPKVDLRSSATNRRIHTEFIESYLKSSQELSAAGVRVAEVDLAASRPPRFLVVQKEDIYFPTRSGEKIALTLEKFLSAETRKELNFSAKDVEVIFEKLIDFAKNTWRFSFIGDFNETQLAYNGHEWVLIDFARDNTKAVSANQRKNIFSPQKYEDHIHEILPAKLYARVEEAIIKERQRQFESLGKNAEPQVWFQRPTVAPKASYKYLFTSETGLSGLIGSKFSLGRSNVSKSANKKIKVTDGVSKIYIEYQITKLVKQGKDSAIFAVKFYNGEKGFIEVSYSVLDKKDEYSAGKGLKKMGYSKSDFAFEGADYVLVVD